MLTSLIKKYKFTMMFDIAAFENKGDPAIIVGELAIIRKLELTVVVVQPLKPILAKNMKLAFVILDRATSRKHAHAIYRDF